MSEDDRKTSKNPRPSSTSPSSLHPVFDTSDLDDAWGAARTPPPHGRVEASRRDSRVASETADAPHQKATTASVSTPPATQDAGEPVPTPEKTPEDKEATAPASPPSSAPPQSPAPATSSKPAQHAPVVAASSPVVHASDARPAVTRLANAESDPIPDWAPWGVLIVLVLAGLAGFLGVFGGPPPALEGAEAGPASAAVPQRAMAPATPGSTEEPRAIRASHLLVQYAGSMRASDNIKRSKEEALTRAKEALVKASKPGADFGALVAEYSDEPGAADRKGNLGKFTRKRMHPAFSDAAFALKPGELSNVVETPFGYHVILRTE